MSTVAAFEKEVAMQVNFVNNFVPQKQLSISKQKRAIFCGTGDSFVAAQLAEIFSNFRAHAFDPLDLLKNKRLAKDSDLYLVSVSGNTISNIKLAKISKNTTAITANTQSRLAKASSNTITLKYENSGIFTAGSISLVASALTCISLVSKIQIQSVSKIYGKAKKESKKAFLGGKIFLLGNMHTLPVAMFGAAKITEVTGLDTHYERIEQFSHMGLFAAKRGDTIIIFEEKNKHNSKLVKILKKHGLNVTQIQSNTKNSQEKILFFIFVSEFIALYHAKKKNQKDCFFVTAKKLRNTSSSMIY